MHWGDHLLGGVADVAVGGELEQALPVGLGDLELGDEVVESLGGDGCFGELAELFVGVGEVVLAHDGLYCFGQDFPGLVQILGDAFGVDIQLQAPAQVLPGQGGVAQGDADVAQACGVGEVTLPAGGGEGECQVVQQGVGHAEVAFCVLKVDGVLLVGHGGGAGLGGGGAGLEVVKGDVAPEVAAEIGKYGVDAHQYMAVFGDAVVGFNLGGTGVPAQPHVLDEAAGDGGPVNVGVGDVMGVVVAGGTV